MNKNQQLTPVSEICGVPVIKVGDGIAEFVLATGETIHVSLDLEGPLGVAPGYRLKLTTLKGTLQLAPSAGNAVVIATTKSLVATAQLVDEAVIARDEKKG